jgi:hypothetical protein
MQEAFSKPHLGAFFAPQKTQALRGSFLQWQTLEFNGNRNSLHNKNNICLK